MIRFKGIGTNVSSVNGSDDRLSAIFSISETSSIATHRIWFIASPERIILSPIPNSAASRILLHMNLSLDIHPIQNMSMDESIYRIIYYVINTNSPLGHYLNLCVNLNIPSVATIDPEGPDNVYEIRSMLLLVVLSVRIIFRNPDTPVLGFRTATPNSSSG